jgi:hypothetical protein
MPWFDDETREDWRLERVLATKVEEGQQKYVYENALKVANKDITDVQSRLEMAHHDIKTHKDSLKALNIKREKLLKLISESK